MHTHAHRRGLELLRVGGLMAYSTCSLNPIEDEARTHAHAHALYMRMHTPMHLHLHIAHAQAVVAALLVRAECAAPGSVVLEAWPQAELLPQLVRRPGVASWRVADHAERAARAGGAGGGGGDGDGGDDDGDSDGGGVGGDGELRLRWHSSHERALAAGCALHALCICIARARCTCNMHGSVCAAYALCTGCVNA